MPTSILQQHPVSQSGFNRVFNLSNVQTANYALIIEYIMVLDEQMLIFLYGVNLSFRVSPLRNVNTKSLPSQ